MGAKQLNIFDVLRGLADENSETYKATIRILTNFPKDLPPPDDGYVPPLINDAKQAPRAASGIRIPNPPPKAVSWFSRNWPWLVLGIVAVGIIIYLYRQRKKKREEEFRKRAERLPKINYPWPSEASSPIITESQPSGSSLIENYFEDLEKEKEFEKTEPTASVPPTNNDKEEKE